MTKYSSKRSMACALVALGVLSLSSLDGVHSKIAYSTMKAKNLKPRFGGPSIVQQVEYMQNAVGLVEEYIRYKSVAGNPGAPDGKKFTW